MRVYQKTRAYHCGANAAAGSRSMMGDCADCGVLGGCQ
ncbi:hypothetical protein BN2497_4477 [Janthinobacterium sp. CG23_2]|nr:hypothetical protein BN2497_4477 [Janthinobacterium sp. CG23_2]CUU28636.1 hypothetical protein BN3177_4477 [Janthinobacterium sp. CG23_2]